MGINSKYELSIAENIMQNRINTKFMYSGVTIRLPDTVYIEDGVVIEGECEIESGVVIKGKTVIKNSYIKANSYIEDAIINNSDIGPFARIRPNSNLDGTHIGNFVEIKNSTLENGVKAGHLSYLGDSHIGENTNIGAGTITCNYDGIKKYKTIIGKNVFIGSDSQLVAPITIEDNSMIAAGTTVTKNVENGSLAISRQPQKNIPNFSVKFFSKK
jgi:bifunctional UDP-N-acetylglucosamine pyrophosphorylase/glucosamine-1-phosphate N-acetyltransferase